MPPANALYARFIPYLIFVLVIFSLKVTAGNFDFSHVLDSHNNAIKNARSLFEDKKGYLWVGGDAGVYRFDGYSAVRVNSSPTRGLYIDHSGRFWSAGTTKLTSLAPDTYASIEYPNLSNKSVKPDHEIIHDMVQTPSHRHFFATNEGLSEYFKAQDQFDHYTLIVNNTPVAITTLLQVDENTLYLGTSKGLFVVSPAQINQQKSSKIRLSNAIIPKIKVQDLKLGPNNALLVGSDNGFYTIDSDDGQINHYVHNKADDSSISSNSITKILLDSEGYIWIGTSRGLNLMMPNSVSFLRFFHDAKNPASLSNNLITDLYQDTNDNILIATYSGIDRYHHRDVHLSSYDRLARLDKSINNVWSMQQDPSQNLWVGTFGSGLMRIDDEQTKTWNVDVNAPNSLVSNRISSLLLDRQNRLWVGTTKGVQWFDTATEQFTSVPLVDNTGKSNAGKGNTQKSNASKNRALQTIFDIAQDPGGSIWLATSFGAIHIDKDIETTTFYDKTSTMKVLYKQWVRTILPLEHRVLVGSDMGLYVLDTQSKTDQHFDEVGSIVKIFRDSSANIWLLSMDGLYLFDLQQQTIKQIKSSDGRFSWACNAISEDAIKQLWLVCAEGLKVVDITSKQIIASYGKQDGVDLSGFLTGAQSMLTTKDGTIIMGERKGISQFRPSSQKRPATQAKGEITQVHLTTVDDNGSGERQPFDFAKTPVQALPAQLQKIEFRFSSLDIAHPKSSQYHYQLAGFEQNWTSTGTDNRRAIYTNLPSGHYTFKVKTQARGKGIKTLEYPFTIATPPWQTLWAYCTYVMILGLMMYGLIVLRTRTLQKRSVALEQSIAMRTTELQQSKLEVEQLMSEREKLVENIYHQSRTPLQIMLGNINALQANELSIDTYASKQTLKVNALVHLTDQILDVSRVTRLRGSAAGSLESVDLSALLNPLVLGFTDVAKTRNLQFDWTIDDNLSVCGQTNSLENAIDNVLSNALKYTDKGVVKFSASQQAGIIVIQCSDTGIGIPIEDQQNMFKRYQRGANATDRQGAGIGLAMVKDVIDALGGAITLSSEPGKGTTVKITLDSAKKDCRPDVPEYQMLDSQLKDGNDKTSLPTALVIEDNLELVAYMVKLLAPNHQVLTALNGQDGLKQARQSVPDIIISDVMMTPMNGFELTQQIRQDEITCHIPILLVTAKSDEDSTTKGYALGANDFITKPFKAPDLLNRVANQLQLVKSIQQRATLPGHNSTQGEHSSPEQEEDRLITRYLLFISNNYQDNELKIKDACKALHISIRQLERKVRHFLDMTPNELLNDYRLSRARDLIKQGQNVSNIYHQCGFSSHAYFSKRYREKFGQLPSQHKNDSKK